MPAAKGSTSGHGAHWASTPQSSTPAATPPVWASVASSAARRGRSPASSTSAAAAAPASMPWATPSTARAAASQAVPLATAKNTSATTASPNPMAITGRRPTRSESWPKTSSAGISTRAYPAKTSASTAVENPNRRAYTAYSGVARLAASSMAANTAVTISRPGLRAARAVTGYHLPCRYHPRGGSGRPSSMARGRAA